MSRRDTHMDRDAGADLPGWFWIAAPVVFVLAIAASAVWPWGWAL